MGKEKVGFDIIETFLEGKHPKKYIVAIEGAYHENFVSLIINDPEKGKRIEKHKYKPFVWLKHEVSKIIYGGRNSRIKSAMRTLGVTIKALKITDDDGVTPERLENGYKFIAECNGSYGNLITFFKIMIIYIDSNLTLKHKVLNQKQMQYSK
mgnify:CR=1 FL=1